MLGILKSIKTSLYLMGVSMFVCVIGSLMIPRNLDVFSEINDLPLMKWLSRNTEHHSTTFWIYGLVLLMAGLFVNMAVCTVDSLAHRFSLKGIVQKISPHIMHAGVLLVLFGHLMSAVFGSRMDVPLLPGEGISVSGTAIHLERVEFVKRPGEDQARWRVHLRADDGEKVTSLIAEPASPAFQRKVAIFAKSAEENGRVLLGLVNDPGVRWQIWGAVAFILGSLGLFWSRYVRIEM